MNVKNYAAYANMRLYQKTREFQEAYAERHDEKRKMQQVEESIKEKFEKEEIA